MEAKTLIIIGILIAGAILLSGCATEEKQQTKKTTIKTQATTTTTTTTLPCQWTEEDCRIYCSQECNKRPLKSCHINETTCICEFTCDTITTTTTTMTKATAKTTSSTTTSMTTTTMTSTTATTTTTTTTTATTTTSSTTTSTTATTTTTSTTSTTRGERTPPCGSYGDVDGDGYVTAEDIQQLTENMETTPLYRADADGNGRIDATDAAYIIMYYNKQTDTFLVCT